MVAPPAAAILPAGADDVLIEERHRKKSHSHRDEPTPVPIAVPSEDAANKSTQQRQSNTSVPDVKTYTLAHTEPVSSPLDERQTQFPHRPSQQQQQEQAPSKSARERDHRFVLCSVNFAFFVSYMSLLNLVQQALVSRVSARVFVSVSEFRVQV